MKLQTENTSRILKLSCTTYFSFNEILLLHHGLISWISTNDIVADRCIYLIVQGRKFFQEFTIVQITIRTFMAQNKSHAMSYIFLNDQCNHWDENHV